MKYGKLLAVFIATYAILLIFGFTGIFAKWDSWLYYGGVFAIFFITYFLFEFLQKEVDFKFAESYIGLIFLILMYLGFWLAFRIYYGNLASLNNISYGEFYKNAGLNMFKYMINSPYIYLSLSAFGGWVAFYIEKFKVKKAKK